MKIVKMFVDWMLGWGNDPRLIVELDGPVPSTRDYVYDVKQVDDHTFYFGEHESGLVSFLVHTPKNERGYGGDTFTLRTASGEVKVKGPWSSNGGAMASVGFPETIEVVTVDPEGHRFGGVHLRLDKARELMPALLPGHELVQPTYGWTVTLAGKTVAESKAFLRANGVKPVKPEAVPAAIFS